MTTRTTYNLLRRGITALALVCISVITFAENVAKIGETEYETLQLAIDAATEGQTVTLIADITETATYTINKKITIDFGEHTITASHTTSDATTNADKVFDITASGNLIVTGSTGGVTDETVLGIFNNAGALTINGGHYTTNTDDYGVVYNNGGTCTIAGGELRGAWAAVYNRTGIVTVNGGTLYGVARGINAKTGTTVNITDGNISSGEIGVYGEESSHITMSNGNVTATATSIYLDGVGAEATISGGTINAKWGVQVTEGGVLSLTAGSITATASGVDVRGEGSTATISGGTITATDGIFVTDHATLIVNTEASITGTNTAISGNGSEGKGNTNITINGGTMTTGENVKGVGIYHPQIGGQLTINGGTITGNTAVEVRSGTLDITGGTLTANAASYSCNPNGSGSTTIGAALAIAQHTTKQNIAVTISGGTFTGVKAISESNPQQNDPAPQVTMSVTNGTFNGGITVVDVQGGFISGGTYSAVDENFGNYLQSGYAVKANSGEPATYSVVAQTKTEVSESIPEGDAKTAAEALAANTATATTTGLAYDQSLEISINNVAVDGGVVKTATFEVTPKDVNGNPISDWSGEVTFRLPISAGVEAGKWVNLKHSETYIPASKVAKDGDNKYVTVTTTSFSPFSYDVLENPVAKIGEQLYETVAAAITAAPESTETTIELIADATENIAIPANKNVKLAGGEHTVSGTITSSGTLTIASGTYTNTTENALKTDGDGTITINAGVFSKEPDASMIAQTSEVMVGESNTYVVAATGTAEAKIGEVKYQTIALAITAAGTEATTITLLKNVAAETIAIPADANITLVLGEVTLTKAITNNGTLNISGGTISGAITNNNALTFTSGTISGNITNAESATMTIAAGTFTGTITNNGTLNIAGGTFASKPSSYTCATDHELIYNGTNYVYDAISAAEAKIGTDSYYYTIAQAIEAAGSSATNITLLKNPTSTETIEIPADANITLVISNGLSKPIANNGALTLESGSTTGNLTIMRATATIIIKDGVTHNGVQLDGSLGDYVLKTITNTGSKLYKAELKYSIQVGSGITDETQHAAAETMALNDALSTTTGLGENQSIAVTILSVTLDGSNNVTSATFNVELSGADGQAITTASNDITFRLPVSNGIQDGKWVNIKNATEAISGGTVNVGHFVEITTKKFPTFSYSILNTEPVAQIGKTKYETVAAAIADANEKTIDILKNIDDAITVAGDKTITLAGGGFELSGAITNSGALTLTSGTYSGAIASNGGTITINGGLFSSSLTTNGGAITIKGGTFASTCTFTETSGDIAISGGTFDVIPDKDVCADGYVPVKNGEGKFNMTDDWKMTDETAIGSIDYYGSHGYTVATATYTRSVGMVGVGGNPDGTKYGTICLPFTITTAPTDGTKLYKATSVTDSKLTITEVTEFSSAIPAGTPLIFELSAVAKTMSIVSTSATINVADLVAPTDGNLLRGTYTETTITGDALSNKYYLNGDAFHQAVNSLKVPAYRAYIEYTTPVGGGSAPERLNIVKANDPVVTPLENATAEVNIVAVYDLQGRNIGRLQSGINIVRLSNGQTVKIIKM